MRCGPPVMGRAAWQKLRSMASLGQQCSAAAISGKLSGSRSHRSNSWCQLSSRLVHCCGVQDAKRRKYETEEERDDLLPRLRDFSRQEYLKKREDAKLQELEDAIRDEEMMFG
jgi:hypothetical protein